eukprot:TRINITY_DN15067_c0_g1_i1.p1 TRINITY_DN15067_c0_g1~~TRINITY_DN15067_c0_g1_i1.p1  ORF type:complete len:444 (+),score=172.86 TRINITY_DN15067_c0_g1_i1:156-1487(+)
MSNAQDAEMNGDEVTQKEEKAPSFNVDISIDDYPMEVLNQYTGNAKIQRLLFIAQHSKSLELEALKLAHDELKAKSLNTSLYKNVCEKIGDRLGASYQLDQSWIDSTDKKAAHQQEKIEADLNGSRTNLIKEQIRIGHTELGDFWSSRGDIPQALKCYSRSRDYCTSPKNMLQMCLNVIRTSFETGNFATVFSYITKAEQTPDLTDKVIQSQLRVCSGLANIDGRKFKPAARKFLETTIDLGNSFSDVLIPQDVAVYGVLCALASYDRTELKKKVIDFAPFKPFLEFSPTIREALNDFYSSRYASCLKHLEKIKPILLLDLHLSQHVESLYQKIRSKALIQYFSPFTSVDLNTMAAAFNTNVNGLEKELSTLIVDGSIQARIDSHNKRLYARKMDQRSSTFQKALNIGEEYEENTKAILLRINLLRSEVVVKPRRNEERRMNP